MKNEIPLMHQRDFFVKSQQKANNSETFHFFHRLYREPLRTKQQTDRVSN